MLNLYLNKEHGLHSRDDKNKPTYRQEGYFMYVEHPKPSEQQFIILMKIAKMVGVRFYVHSSFYYDKVFYPGKTTINIEKELCKEEQRLNIVRIVDKPNLGIYTENNKGVTEYEVKIAYIALKNNNNKKRT